jgi:hypothetical protein
MDVKYVGSILKNFLQDVVERIETESNFRKSFCVVEAFLFVKISREKNLNNALLEIT